MALSQPRHRRGSSDETRRGRGKIGHRGFGFDPRPSHTGDRRRRLMTACGPVAKQAIAAARLSLQQTPIRTKRLADRARMNVKCIFPDDRARPDAMRQFVFGDDLSRRSGKSLDDSKGSAANRHR